MLKQLFKNNYPRGFKLLIDLFFIMIIWYLMNQLNDLQLMYINLMEFVVFPTILVIILYVLKSYSSMYRYFNMNDIFRLVIGIALSCLFYFFYKGNFEKLNALNYLLLFFTLVSVLVSYRIFIKLLFSRVNKAPELLNNMLIFSAGNSGVLTKRAFYNSTEFKILGFVDDDTYKIGKTLDGVVVFKLGDKLNKFIIDNNVTRVVISTNKLSQNRLTLLFEYFQNLNVQILKLPPVQLWINGIPNVSRLKAVKIEDLLSRGLITVDNQKNKLVYRKKSVLVTGAAGSIGSEIVRQIVKYKPARIVLLDNAETPMFNMKKELDMLTHNMEFEYHVDSVCDKKVLDDIFSRYNFDIVFHAAAYKHVNMMESNPKAAITNNVYGTKQVIDYSLEHNVKKFVLISSDKAVNPTNVMGASKRICELYLASKITNEENETKFITTRFGNVLASNGSVVPIFEEQIGKGGPVTVTHPDIMRYFMTITEASQLVLEAGAMGNGGEVFVFDMGDPVKIVDLATKMITQKGLKVGIDIKIEYTGLRPGEKLYEELLVNSENLLDTYNDLIYISKKEVVGKEVSSLIDDLIDIAFNDGGASNIVGIMKKIVPEYISNNSEFESLDNND